MIQLNSQITRRAFAQSTLAAGLGITCGLRHGNVALAAPTDARRPRRQCIVLWMDGGPSHIDTFDPKPDASSDIRGQFSTINTRVPGIQFGDRFENLAGVAQHLAIVRSMSTEEADHGRARIYMHTGYKPGQGGVTYPPLGAIAANELADPTSAAPRFVTTGTPLNKYDYFTDPGYLGPANGAIADPDPSRPLENIEPTAPEAEAAAREAVLEQLNRDFVFSRAAGHGRTMADAHRASVDRAARLMHSETRHAFDIGRERDGVREAYGDHDFGRGVLMARRLIEVGVPLVEVYAANWDIHEKRAVESCTALMPAVDRAMAMLVKELAERGLLETTLVVWMGEFGRTPRVNRDGGRDHYAKAWTTVLAGAGVRGGQTIGRTDSMGAEVTDRPVSAKDWMATLCRALQIDATRKFNTPIGRPVTLVDTGAKAVDELF